MGYSNAVVFAEKHTSYLGSYLLEAKPEYDICTIISMPDRISFRTRREDVDVSKIAQTLGGGGHKKAAGAVIDKRILSGIIHEII